MLTLIYSKPSDDLLAAIDILTIKRLSFAKMPRPFQW